ncbi:MAG: GNAT family N-acetyltransferase [Rhodocyclaceae bacterium]|nr:MAG: GNAT family N-acetyltransferase [Rhodocyclaceae bacterium]
MKSSTCERASMIEIITKAPAECTEDELRLFCSLVLTEGQVNPDTLSANVRRADWLGFAYIGNDLAATAAIKNAHASYREKVTQKSGSPVELADIPHEFGYVVVAPEHRSKGLSGALASALLEADDGSIFATSTTENHRMHRALEHLGFKKSGNPYRSTEHPDEEIALFILTR